jgi:tetratricopeptide (TPR) repeat protein
MPAAPARTSTIARCIGAAVVAALFVAPSDAGAQVAERHAPASAPRSPLKRFPARADPADGAACPRFTPPAPPSAAQREQARQRAALGQEAAIIGNQRAARDQLQRAAELDPTDREVAYQLARMLDESGSADQAVREYCRYLALAPAEPDTIEVRARIAELTAARDAVPSDVAGAAFATGVREYEAGSAAAAEASFSAALSQVPTWAEAHYNRGVTRRARGARFDAARDFRRYLDLRPAADDRAEVLARIDSLVPPPSYQPSRALSRGVLFPGLGQLYTDRPALAAAAMVATGTALGLAFRVREDVRRTIVNTEGIPFVRLDTARTRPHLVPGLAAAVAITGGAAYEAYAYASRAWRERRSVAPDTRGLARSGATPIIRPIGAGMEVGVRVPLGRKR